MSIYSPMQLDEPSSTQGYTNQGYSAESSWPSRPPTDGYNPSQTEARFDSARNAHYSYHPEIPAQFGYGFRSSRDLPPADGGSSYRHHAPAAPWPARRDSHGAGGPGPHYDVAPSASSSPGDDYGYNPDGSERSACHCGKVFRRPSDLAKHQKYHIKYFYCLAPDCEKAFATQKDLTRHARTHRKGEGYRCLVEGCRKAANGHIYSRKDNFDRHMRTAHPTHPNV